MYLDKEDVYIPEHHGNAEAIMHAKWSEEAKERVREARKAGRSVYEMFGSFYKNAANSVGNIGRGINKSVNNYANNTIYKKQRANALDNYRNDSHYAKINKMAANRTSDPRVKAKLNQWSRETSASAKKWKKQLANKSTGRVVGDLAKAGLHNVEKSIGKTTKGIRKGIDKGVNNAVNTVARNTIYKNRITKFNKDYNKINRIYKQYKGNMGKEERHAWTKAMHDERKKQLGNRSTKRVLNDFGKDIDKKTKKIRKNINRVVDDAATAVGNATVYKKKRQSISNKVASLRKQQGKSKSMSEAMTRERQIKKVSSKLNKRVSAGKVVSDISKAVGKNIDGATKGARKSMKKAERDFGKGVDKAATAIGNHTISRYRDYQNKQDLEKMSGQFGKYMAKQDMNSAKNQKEWKAAKKRVESSNKRIKDAERRKKRVVPAKQVVSDALGELTGRYKNYGR